jgi:hypothetical protein
MVFVLLSVSSGFAQMVCTGEIFDDVTEEKAGPFCSYIEYFSTLGITGGCSASPPLYCPDNPVTRGQMAIFLTAALEGVAQKRVTGSCPSGQYISQINTDGTVDCEAGAPGPTGPQGPQGAQGPQGPAGPPGDTSALSSRIDSLEASVSSLLTQLNTLSGRVLTLETNFTSLQGSVTTIQQTVNTLSTPSSIYGEVTDAQAASAIAGASISLTPGNLSAVTSISGGYTINVPPGFYTATFSAQSFASKSAQVTVTQNAATQVSVTLSPTVSAVTQQWQTTDHANVDKAISVAVGTPHCSRCHSQQGFVAWLPQLANGDSGQLKKPDGTVADSAYLESLGITPTEVQPITCSACHNLSDNSLRLTGSIPLLPSGFGVAGMGKGAICAACHNSRNGLHDDTAGLTSYTTPHVASSLDVFMGKNAYFMSSAAPRYPHATITDTCVNCHMAPVPSLPGQGYQDLGKNHSFNGGLAGCTGCHPGVDGSSIAAVVTSQLSSLSTDISTTAMYMLNEGGEVLVRAWNPAADLYSSSSSSNSNISLSGVTITSIELLEIHGQMGFHMILSDPLDIQWTDGNWTYATREIWAQIGSIKYASDSTNVFSLGSNLPKAFWNYMLLSRGSAAAHNPIWAQDVITRTLSQDLTE